MYDSRTDKARTPQSEKAKRAHWLREDQRRDDLWVGRRKKGRAEIVEVLADLDDDEAAVTRDCESVEWPDARDYPTYIQMDRMHEEALKMHAQWYEARLDDPPLDLAPWEAELVIGGVPEGTSVAWSTEINDFDDAAWEARLRLEAEDAREREAQYDHAYGGYSDDPDCGDHGGCWLPFMRIEELRDTFGHNWLGNGFHIIDGNGIRRSK